MAIALDTNSSSGTQTSVTSFSWSHTVSGADRILVVRVFLYDSTDSNRSVSSITYAGNSFTKIREDSNDLDNFTISTWYLSSPPTGSNTIAVNLAGSNLTALGIGSSLTGVSSSSPIDTHGGAIVNSASAVSATLTASQNGTYAIDGVIYGLSTAFTTIAPTGGQTNEYSGDLGFFNQYAASRKENLASGSHTLGWDDGGYLGTNYWAYSLVFIVPATGIGINVSDDGGVQENITSSVSSDQSTNETEAVGENVNPQLTSNQTTSEQNFLQESVNSLAILQINVFDALSPQEGISPQIISIFSVYETAVTQEGISATGDVSQLVFETVITQESTTVQRVDDLPVSVIEISNVAENISVVVTPLHITATETVVVQEGMFFANSIYQQIQEEFFLSEEAIATGDLFLSVASISYVNESVSSGKSIGIFSYEFQAQIEEISSLVNPLLVNIYDDAGIVESTDLTGAIFREVFEELAAQESTARASEISVSVGESVYEEAVSSSGTVFFSSQETISAAESVSALRSLLSISVQDSITTQEEIINNAFFSIEINEVITITEQVFKELYSLISVYESVSLNESIALRVAFSISVYENTPLSESIGLTTLRINPQPVKYRPVGSIKGKTSMEFSAGVVST